MGTEKFDSCKAHGANFFTRSRKCNSSLQAGLKGFFADISTIWGKANGGPLVIVLDPPPPRGACLAQASLTGTGAFAPDAI